MDIYIIVDVKCTVYVLKNNVYILSCFYCTFSACKYRRYIECKVLQQYVPGPDC